jgi:hypothetical protein
MTKHTEDQKADLHDLVNSDLFTIQLYQEDECPLAATKLTVIFDICVPAMQRCGH